MPASNTRECFTDVIGLRVVGVLFDAMWAHRGHTHTTLVFEDGTGLTFSHKHGSYWREGADEISRAVQRKKQELDRTSSEIKGVLALAGALDV